MKIKVTDKSFSEVQKIQTPKHVIPKKQPAWVRTLLKFLSKAELRDIDFSYTTVGMEQLDSDEPAIFLMNHSSFTDLQIAATLLAKKPYQIVCTNDGFIGKESFMRMIGCIPSKKFITDVTLIKDMKYAIEQLRHSILMYPEASYSFDGSATPLPSSLGKCIKMLKTPVVTIITEGAFLRDPLYNNLQKRKTKVSATVKYLLSPTDIAEKSADEINLILQKAFTYDHFQKQYEKNVHIYETFRADGLHRVLYKCPICMREDGMEGLGTQIMCKKCGLKLTLAENGELVAESQETPFQFPTQWYQWERDAVKQELLEKTYHMEADVSIKVMVDMKSIYHVGTGHLTHTADGFTLIGCDGTLEYTQSGVASYSLYADYFWYEIGDMISIGNNKIQYYCFPLEENTINVAKARLATEEIYKMHVQK